MVIKPDFKLITFEKGDMVFKFLESGDIFEILHKDVMVNLFRGTVREGSLNNIYLRIYCGENVSVVPLIGIKSNSKMYLDKDVMVFEGEEFGIRYNVRFSLRDNCLWFYEVDLYGSDCEVDLLYCQDVGIANKRACLNNELYVSQYIDHKVLEGENGFVVCSRQNQDQGGRHPYVEQGCIGLKVVSYSTDQMQFFSKSYKRTNLPYCLDKDLPKENYQFELSYVCLQTERIKLNKCKRITFYGLFKESYEGKVCELKYEDYVRDEFKNFGEVKNNLNEVKRVHIKSEFGKPLSSKSFREDEVKELYSNMKFVERDGDQLLSFFTDYHSHVVMMEKEVMCERPHGHIIINGVDTHDISTNIISSTNYMFGIFNSHVVLGNTSLNKLMSVNRGLLNVMKNSGQRIYVKLGDKFHMLTLSGIYEMGMNFSKWYYKLDDDVLVIESYVLKDSPRIVLNLSSVKGHRYEFIVSNQFVVGECEFENEFMLKRNNYTVNIKPVVGSFLSNTYEGINYDVTLRNCEFQVSDDRIFFKDNAPRDESLITFKVLPTCKFTFIIDGYLDEVRSVRTLSSLECERDKFNEFYKNLLNGFKLDGKSSKYDLDKLNEIVYFYTHNALIHFASPHGLEQSSGAAWGTRDVCQGPIEFFSATSNYELVRKIILKVFSHQFFENGQWPQWFMFDKYNMQQDDSHGDIIFWPLKGISEYVLNTGDNSIFKEVVSYRSFPSCEVRQGEEVIEHIRRGISGIKERFINGTHLVSYDGGDWDDTLQPINEDLKKRLISTWTMALAYKTLKDLHEVIEEGDLKDEIYKMYKGIGEDFTHYAIKDHVISGFLYFNEENNIRYMLHPLDDVTGIKYRLLPLTRSIISEMIDLHQADINEEIIEKHLTFNDGVRLMSSTPKYDGGMCKIFKRAEQASNVGREISLQYVHAHIRFIEAMCKLGREEKVWDALYRINPIGINDFVKNASYRQSNCYFSSSDGEFNTRYDFYDNFSKLKEGEVSVKGGWRVYSSGPGIYINQLITNVIGIRELEDRIVFDPIISKNVEDLRCTYKILGKDAEIIFLKGDSLSVNLNGEEIESIKENNIYGREFNAISKDVLKGKLLDEKNIFKVYLV